MSNLSTAFPSASPTGLPTQAPTAFVVPDENALHSMLITYAAMTIGFLGLYAYLVHAKKLAWLLEPKGPARFKDIFRTDRAGWLNVHENEFVAKCGLDAYMSLRGIRLMGMIMLGYLLCAGIILLPSYRFQTRTPQCIAWCSRTENLYHTSDYDSGCVCNSVDRYSLANVASESSGLWLPVLGMVICTAVLLYLLRKEYQEVVRIRSCYWLSMPPQMFTVLIDDIPDHLGIHTAKGLRDHFENLFPGQVVEINPAKFHDEEVLAQLRRTGIARMNSYDQLERLIALRTEYGENVPACHSLCLNSCTNSGSLSSQIQVWRSKFQELNVEFEELLAAYRALEEQELAGYVSRPIVSSFVTFSSATAAAVATQAVLEHRFNVVAVPSPEPDDVQWDSLGYGVQQRACWMYSARFGFFMLVLFWGVLVSFVGAMTSVEALENQFEWLRDFLEKNDAMKSFIEQAAPLLLTALVAIVNPIVCLLARLEARASEGDADHLATIWFFAFLVIQIFIFYGVSGSLLKTLNPILDHPAEIIDVLATSIPKNANFYIQFIVTKFVTSLCLDLFRVSDLSVHVLRRVIFGRALSERDNKIARCGCGVISFPGHRNLSSLNGNMLLLFFIATSYAVIQPLIVPAALIFYMMAYFVYAKLFVSVNMQRFDSGGTLWPRTYWCYVSAILTAQLTLIGLLSLKHGVTEPSVVTLLFLATWFVAALIDFRYRRLVLETPLDLASQVDSKIDHSLQGVEVPASVWQYGVLSNGEPNYYGRDLGFNSLESKALRSQVVAISTPLASDFLPYNNATSGSRRPTLQHTAASNGTSSSLGEEDTGAGSDNEALPRPPIPPRTSSDPILRRGSVSSDQSVSSPPASLGRRPFEYYSYKLPVTKESPLMELSPQQVFLEPSHHDSDENGASLRDPLLQ